MHLKTIFRKHALLDKFIGLLIVLWIGMGFYYSYPTWRVAWSMLSLFQYSEQEKRVLTYGADWLAYENFMEYTDEDSRILMLLPDKMYWYRLYFFAYPRDVDYVTTFDELHAIDWNMYDYFYIYIPLRSYEGIVNLRRIMREDPDDWTFENIHVIEKRYFPESSSESTNELKVRVVQTNGNLIYKVPDKTELNYNY